MRFISVDNRGLQHVVKHISNYIQAKNVTSNNGDDRQTLFSVEG